MKPKWVGNHNPDHDKWSVNNGLTLRTATATNHPHWARITLTHRIQGPTSTATIQPDYATDSNWNTTGTEVASANVTGGRRPRAAADIHPGASRPGTFSHSTDGTDFTRPGPRSPWATPGRFFRGYRFALPATPRGHSAAPSASRGSH